MGGLYTDYIMQGMLEQHNVEVEFVSIGRWTEVDDMNTALASGDAPDVCVTYSYPTIAKYAQMGGIVNLNDIGGKKLEEYKDILPNLWDLLGDNNIYYDQDPDSGNLWAVEARLADNARSTPSSARTGWTSWSSPCPPRRRSSTTARKASAC